MITYKKRNRDSNEALSLPLKMAKVGVFIMLCVMMALVSVYFIFTWIKMMINKKHDHTMGKPIRTDKITPQLSVLSKEITALTEQLDHIISRHNLSKKMLATHAVTVDKLTRNHDNLLQKTKQFITDGEKTSHPVSEIQTQILLNKKQTALRQIALLTMTEQLDNLMNETAERHTVMNNMHTNLADLYQHLDKLQEYVAEIKIPMTPLSDKINQLHQNNH